MNDIIKNHRKDIILAIALGVITFLLLYIFSNSTSPQYENIAFDQNNFNLVGREWAKGKIPYIFTWDNKGPIVYFFNMLGYKLYGNIFGIFVIENIHLYIAALIAFIMLREYFRPIYAFFSTILFLFSYITISDGANQAGEYNLWLSLVSIFFAYKWSRRWNEGNPYHPWKYALFYGMFFAAGLLTRATNALPIIILSAAIFFILIYNKLWHNLITNVIAFVFGFAVIFLPFAIYFALHGAFNEMWYAAISYNIEYALTTTQKDFSFNHSLIYSIIWFICIISVLLYSITIIITNKKDRKFGILWLIVSSTITLWLANSLGSRIYAISYLPMLFIPIVDNYKNEKQNKYAITVSIISVGIIILGFLNYCRIYYNSINNLYSDKEDFIQMKLSKRIPRGSNMVVYNCDAVVYLFNNMSPCYKYFTCQDWVIKCGPSLKQKVRKEFNTLRAEWIIIKDMKGSSIEDILKRHYKVIETDKYIEPGTNKVVYICLMHRK